MNREIKFRARGGDVLKYFVYFGIFDQTEDYVIDSQVQNDGSHHILQKNDIESVDRFTGLLDKNGKEIYEGDVVSLPSFEHGELQAIVEWDDAQFTTKYGRLNEIQNLAIIGNCYENSDLLV